MGGRERRLGYKSLINNKSLFEDGVTVCWPRTFLTWAEAGEDDKAALFLQAGSFWLG